MSTSNAIPHSYIVVFKKSATPDVCDTHCTWAHEKHLQSSIHRVPGIMNLASTLDGVGHTYTFENWRGYAGSFDDDLKKQIEEAEEVDFVEPDHRMYTKELVSDTAALSWGLARLSHKKKLSEETDKVYNYDDTAGSGVKVYVLDTGILAEHEDFEGRASFGFNAATGSQDTDTHGHGTHVAGTVGGKKFGVAKKVSIVGVKVLGDNGSGSTSGVIAGLQWALEDATTAGKVKTSVINMSLGGTKSRALNNAVAAVVAKGLTVCVAAGNEGTDASTSSPASEPSAITVGAISVEDKMATYSNYGPLVDIFAPGTGITSDWIGMNGKEGLTSTKTISGTSMASPHVAGLCAYLISKDGLEGSEAVAERIKGLATSDKITEVKGKTFNRLAYNGIEKPQCCFGMGVGS